MLNKLIFLLLVALVFLVLIQINLMKTVVTNQKQLKESTADTQSQVKALRLQLEQWEVQSTIVP